MPRTTTPQGLLIYNGLVESEALIDSSSCSSRTAMEINAADEIDKCEAGGGAEPQPADPEPDAAAALEQQQQPWREQLTARGLVAAALIGSMYTVVVMKLNLTTGFVPTMNVSAALLAFLALRGWTGALSRLGVAGARPFTRQENTVVQTCAVACYSLALCGTCQTPDSFARSLALRGLPSAVPLLPCHGLAAGRHLDARRLVALPCDVS